MHSTVICRKLEERESWYTARFVADDAPDWNPATFVSAMPVANGLTCVALDIEISRERVGPTMLMCWILCMFCAPCAAVEPGTHTPA